MLRLCFNDRVRWFGTIAQHPVIRRSHSNLGMLMKQLNDAKQFRKALALFDECQPQNLNELPSIVLTQAFKACTKVGDYKRASDIHSGLSSQKMSDPFIIASVIHLNMQSGNVINAERIFDGSRNKTKAMYGAMIKGLIKNKMFQKAIDLFEKISDPDEVLVLLLFNACAQVPTIRSFSLARDVFSRIPSSFHRNPRLSAAAFDMFLKHDGLLEAERLFATMKSNVINYGNLMNSYNERNQPLKTLHLFERMKIDRIDTNPIICLLLINACSRLGMEFIARSIVSQMPSLFLSNHRVRNALIDMWGKTGSTKEATLVFDTFTSPDAIGMTAMVNAYGLNGEGLQAIEVFRRMPSEWIDEPSVVCVLNACSHAGLVSQARQIFEKITARTEKIFTVMVDCLSRAFFFEEAQHLINVFERNHQPGLPMYMALLSGARNQSNLSFSQQVFDRMKKLFADQRDFLVSGSVLLANVYGASGDLHNASQIQAHLSRSDAKKEVGLAWTEVDGELAEFRAHDQTHPQASLIYAELEQLAKELVEHGHQFDGSWVTRPMKRNETIESILCGHSEKIAIAFNFIRGRKPSRIQVTKNLRVCGDCHRATKLIALIRRCHIIVRDANRIHHFSPDGRCSCGDHF